MLHLLALSTLGIYLAVSILSLIEIFLKNSKLMLSSTLLIRLGAALHILTMLILFTDERSKQIDSTGDYYFTASLLIVFILISIKKYLTSSVLTALASGFAALFLGNSSYLIHITPSETSVPSPTPFLLLAVHVAPALIAEVSLVFIFVISTIFLIQEKKIREKSPEITLEKPPSLLSIEKVNGKFSILGFATMTLAVISGVVWSISENQKLVNNSLSTWFALASWCALGYILHARNNNRFSPRKLSLISMAATGLCILSFLFISLFTGNSLHGKFSF